MATHFILADLVKVYKESNSKENCITVLAWGDPVELVKETDNFLEIKLKNFATKPDGSILPVFTTGFIAKSSKSATAKIIASIEKKNVLMVSFADVQQGDASVIETPKGKTILIDGGENQMFARYLAARYSGSSLQQPKDIDCIVVSHGDADHFEGLPQILESEKHKVAKKRLFINPMRVFHNGIIKRPLKDAQGKKFPEAEALGKTIKKGKETYLCPLVDDLLTVKDEEMNTPFRRWKKTLQTYKDRNPHLQISRLDDKSKNNFDFLHDEGISVTVLGPLTETISNKPALKFLREPERSVELNQTRLESRGSLSASHTINGHSVILKLTYGNVNFLFAGDLNEEAEETLVRKTEGGQSLLRSEVLKVPHHGSADFSNKFFEAVNPLVSVVSSGDESEVKEYIHPRATLMGVLGKYSRYERPLVFVTEMVAFFKREGWSKVVEGSKKGTPFSQLRDIYAFSRTAYGIVHLRTDGKRLLVYTHSGQKDLKEAYSFIISENGDVERKDVVIK